MVLLAQGGLLAQGPVVNSKAGDAVDPKAAQRNAVAGVTAADFAALFAALPGDTDALVPGAGAAGRAPLTPGAAGAKPAGASPNAARRPNAALAAIPWVEMPAIAPPMALPIAALAGALLPDPAMAAALLQGDATAAAEPAPVPDMPPDVPLPSPVGMTAVDMPAGSGSVLPAPVAALPQDPAKAGVAATPSTTATIAPVSSSARPVEADRPLPKAAPGIAVPASATLPPPLPVTPVVQAAMPAVDKAAAAVEAPVPATPPAVQAVMPVSAEAMPTLAGVASNAVPSVVAAMPQTTPQPLPSDDVIRSAGAPSVAAPGTSLTSVPVRMARDVATTRGLVMGKPQAAESRADGLPILTEALMGEATSRRAVLAVNSTGPGQPGEADQATDVTPPLAATLQVLPEVAVRPHDVAQPMDLAVALVSSAAASAPPGAAPPAAAPLPATMAPLPPQLAAEARQQVALRVASAVASGVDTVSVDLRPPELGRVEVRLTFHENSVQVVVAAERATTYEAFRQDRAHLEQQLAQAGFDLGGGALDLRHGGLPREREPEPPKPASAAATPPVDGAAEDLAGQPAGGGRRLSNSLIDLIA